MRRAHVLLAVLILAAAGDRHRRLHRHRRLPAVGGGEARRRAGRLVHHRLGPQPQRHGGQRHVLPAGAPGQPGADVLHRHHPARRHRAVRQRRPAHVRASRRSAPSASPPTSRSSPASRIYSQSGALKDSVGQYFAGTPASFAIGSGQSTELVGVYGDPAVRRLDLPLQLRVRGDDRDRHLHGEGHGEGPDRRAAGEQDLHGAAVGADCRRGSGRVPGPLDPERAADRGGDLRDRQGDRVRLRGGERLPGPGDVRDGVPGRAAGGERVGRWRDITGVDRGRGADRRRDERRCDGERGCRRRHRRGGGYRRDRRQRCDNREDRRQRGDDRQDRGRHGCCGRCGVHLRGLDEQGRSCE